MLLRFYMIETCQIIKNKWKSYFNTFVHLQICIWIYLLYLFEIMLTIYCTHGMTVERNALISVITQSL